MRMGKKLQIKYKIQVMATVLIIPPVVRPENVAYVRTDTDGTDVQPISPANGTGDQRRSRIFQNVTKM